MADAIMGDVVKENGFEMDPVNMDSLIKQSPDSPEPKMSQRRIMKNLIVISVSFNLLFTAFDSLSNLQSSLNKEEGLGVIGLAVIYGAMVLSCCFIPSFVIARLGCKWTLILSMSTYILYMTANFHAVWGTIVPTAIILGLGAAPLWSAHCTYLTEIGVWYARKSGATRDAIINKFFGIFFMIYQTNQVAGNLISSLVFNERLSNTTNVTMEIEKCGATFCPGDDAKAEKLKRPELSEVYIVCGFYVAAGVLAIVLVSIGLDPIVLDKETSEKRQLSFKLMLDTTNHLKSNLLQKLLVVLTMYIGMQQAFIVGDFTKSYVGCALGIWNIGYVMICHGIVNALCCILFGRLVQYVGHIPFFVLAFLVEGGLEVTLLLWKPVPDNVVLIYVLGALWGVGDAVFQTLVYALYGDLFRENSEAAFSNFKLWESGGYIIAFASQNFLCTYVKIYMCLGFLFVGMILYGIAEFLHRRRKLPQHD